MHSTKKKWIRHFCHGFIFCQNLLILIFQHDRETFDRHVIDSKRFMWILMEEFTNLSKYPVPYEPSLVKAIIAEEVSNETSMHNVIYLLGCLYNSK